MATAKRGQISQFQAPKASRKPAHPRESTTGRQYAGAPRGHATRGSILCDGRT
jgi:hypothetical protein